VTSRGEVAGPNIHVLGACDVVATVPNRLSETLTSGGVVDLKMVDEDLGTATAPILVLWSIWNTAGVGGLKVVEESRQ